jgi:hypothetical protein
MAPASSAAMTTAGIERVCRLTRIDGFALQV